MNKELELELVVVEKELTNEDKIRILLDKSQIILNRIMERKQKKDK